MHMSYDVCGVWYANLKKSLYKLNIACHIYQNPNVERKFFKREHFLSGVYSKTE